MNEKNVKLCTFWLHDKFKQSMLINVIWICAYCYQTNEMISWGTNRAKGWGVLSFLCGVDNVEKQKQLGLLSIPITHLIL